MIGTAEEVRDFVREAVIPDRVHIDNFAAETLAGHGARPLSTSGCAPSTNAITAAEKRSARPRFCHSTTGANCGLPTGLACLPSQSRTGLEGRAAHGPFGPTKIGRWTSCISVAR